MTWRKRQEHMMDEDIVEPSEWRINMNEFGSELNGFLDNDNILEHSLDAREVKRDTFTQVLINQKFSQYGYLFSHLQSGWTNRADFLVHEGRDTVWDGIKNKRALIGHKSFASPPGPGSAGGDAASYDFEGWATVEEKVSSPILARKSKQSTKYSTQLPFQTFSTETDALVIVDFHGTVSWQVGTGSMNNAWDFWKDWHYNLYPGASFTKRYTTNGYAFHRPKGYYYRYMASSVLCSMWRVVVDGMIVAETGPLGSEYQHHPIYLSGAIPVSSGSHRVELQSQLVWYSPGSDKTVQSSAGNRVHSYNDGTNDYDINLRHDCELRHPNLITQIRSR